MLQSFVLNLKRKKNGLVSYRQRICERFWEDGIMGDPSYKPKATTAATQSQTMIGDGSDKDHSKRT